MSCPWCFVPNPGTDEFGGCKACGRSAVPTAADGWTPLHDPSGDLTVAVGTTCLFAVRTRAGWKHFIDAVTCDAGTEPQWRCAEHGWELCNIIYWRPLPEPPKGKP